MAPLARVAASDARDVDAAARAAAAAFPDSQRDAADNTQKKHYSISANRQSNGLTGRRLAFG